MVYLAKKLTNKSYITAAAVAALLIIAGIFLLARSHSRRAAVTIPSTPAPARAQTASPDKASSNSGNTVNTSNPVNADKSTPPPAANLPLNSPSGTFVSNHHPGQNGTDSKEQSVCNTTPGAVCFIQFTKDGVTKKLDAQVTDPTGAAYWTWDVKDAGFSSGSWQVSAIATLNGQTKTASDVIALEVQP